MRMGLAAWLSLLVYNVVSALFNINRCRRGYVRLLRMLYAVSKINVLALNQMFYILFQLMGSRMKSSNATNANVKGILPENGSPLGFHSQRPFLILHSMNLGYRLKG